jgi:hypothetical protein
LRLFWLNQVLRKYNMEVQVWVGWKHHLRGAAICTVAAPGQALDLLEATGLSIGRDLLADKPIERRHLLHPLVQSRQREHQ